MSIKDINQPKAKQQLFYQYSIPLLMFQRLERGENYLIFEEQPAIPVHQKRLQ
jgi:hypothetical protein